MFLKGFQNFVILLIRKEAREEITAMQRDDRYRKLFHENEYVLKMQNEVLPYLERRVSEAWIPVPENRRVHVLRYLADKARCCGHQSWIFGICAEIS